MKRLIILLLLILGTNTWAADLRIQGWSYPNVYEPSDTTELIFYGPNGTYNMPWSVLRDRIDSKLSASEVMLTAVSTEPAGANCTYGGQRLDIGLDDDADGLLDTEEIDATRYVCNGNPGTTGSDGADGLATLATVTAEPSGANCTNGGQRLDIGVDDDADGLLDAGEIDVTRYLCNGVDGATDWSQLSNVPPFGSASLVDTGNTAGDIPIFVACGTCSDQQYTTEATCTGAGGTWTLTGEVCLNVEIDIASLADAGGLISQTLSQLQCPDGQIPRSNGNGYVCSPDGTAATEISIADAGGLYSSITVEGALAEVMQAVDTLNAAFVAAGIDTVPDAFTFTDVTDATVSTLYVSNAITVGGINFDSSISVSGGEYDINNAESWTSASGTVSSGDTVEVRQTSSATGSTQTDTVLTIGGVSDTYSVTTESGIDYSDILFYHGFETSADCTLNNAEYSAGDATPTCQSGVAISTTMAFAGTNSLSVPTDYDRMEFDISAGDIVDHVSGRIGFAFHPTVGTIGATVYRAFYDANNYIQVALYDGIEPLKMRVTYMAGGTSAVFDTTDIINLDTDQYVELKVDQGSVGNDFEVFVNGVSVATDDTATGVWGGTPTVMALGDVDGVQAPYYLDQFYSSSDPERDLYALRNLTNAHP